MLNTASFPAYVKSLNIKGSVTTQVGAMVAGPPPPIAELGVRLGLGGLFLNTPQTKSILANIGLDPALTDVVSRRLRSLKMWRTVWEDLAAPHLKAVDAALARGDNAAADAEIRTALTMLGLAYSGDGYYIYVPLPERRRILPVQRRLYQQLRELNGDRVERVEIRHARGITSGLLHFPLGATGRVPALLVIHPLAGDKDDYDVTVAAFREAGFATLCVDMPAHGENFEGSRIRPDDEQVAMAALEVLAIRPEVQADQLAVAGGSLGAFFALRTAAVSPRVKACLAFASPFDIGSGIAKAVPGIRQSFAWVVGAQSYEETLEKGKLFSLYDVPQQIKCPVLIVHGTRDHICDFTASYEIARRVRAPLTVQPIVGADHEVAQPKDPRIVGPALEWLKTVLNGSDR
jgi:pimeloyl-ACP methyl ester carboxylesterase